MRKIKILILTMMIMICCTVTAFAAGDAFSATEAFLGDTKTFMVQITTLVAVIGIAFGALKIKTAAGNPQKIDVGFNAIKWSIIGWVLVNGAPLIFATINKYIA